MTRQPKLRVDLAADMRQRFGLDVNAEAGEALDDPKFGLTDDEFARVAKSEKRLGEMRHGSATAKAEAKPTGLRIDLAAAMRRRCGLDRDDEAEAPLRVDMAAEMRRMLADRDG